MREMDERADGKTDEESQSGWTQAAQRFLTCARKGCKTRDGGREHPKNKLMRERANT